MSVLVSNIQRFSVNDGPGIRTTIFTVGCNLRCPWCANPENIVYDAQMAEKTSNQLRQIEYSIEELYNIIMRDYEYYGDKGGVTFSGGEPLLWGNELIGLFVKLKKRNISICIETALGISRNVIKEVSDYIDYWYVDLKTCDRVKARQLGLVIESYFDNLQLVSALAKWLIVRIPLFREFNVSYNDICIIREYLEKYKICNVEYIFAHNLARKKYLLLDKDFHDYTLSAEEKNNVKNIIKTNMDGFEGAYMIHE